MQTPTPPIVSATPPLDKLNTMFRGTNSTKKVKRTTEREHSAYRQGSDFGANKHRYGSNCCGSNLHKEIKSTKGLKLSNLIQSIKVNGHTGTIVLDSKLGRINSQLDEMIDEQ